MNTEAPRAPTFIEALRYWFKLGCISFGGPAGQIAIMHTELVDKRRWISEGRFLHALNYCMVLPGPEAQQLAIYLGWLLHGVRGGIVAGALFVLPSLLVLIALSWAYLALGPAVSTVLLAGVKPAVVAVVAFAAWRIGSKTLRHPALWALAILSLLVLSVAPHNVAVFPLLLLTAATVGWALRHRFKSAAHGSAQSIPHAPALIDDHTPSPAHAQIHLRRLLAIALAALLLGAASWSILVSANGSEGVLARMAAFFTQAALLTFGGAYAVMPYVFQNAVQTYGWISAPQMLDGLALGESTPGPLIMVVAFIGYVGAAGPTHTVSLGVAGAMVATLFTFLPSFLFILIGAPFVERSRNIGVLAAPLTAITAAVVGAILHLALTLAAATLIPQGAVDLFGAALALLGLLALVRGWLGILPLLALSAVLGWLHALV